MEIINKLRELLMAYTSTKVYELNVGSKATVASIFITISLYELGELWHRPIADDEKHWFEGGYSVSRDFDSPEWEDISKLYDEIVKAVKKKNFYRS